MARPGADSPFDETQMKVGRRLAVKVLNASKFVLGLGGPADASAIIAPVDKAMLTTLAGVVEQAGAAFDAYEYTTALETAETFFWSFCDDYLELVKERAYGTGAGAQSARAALQLALDALQRLFAPFLPFVTEEVWSWWRPGSIHQAAWPVAAELADAASGGEEALITDVAAALIGIRGVKSSAKVSMKTPLHGVAIVGPAASIERLRTIENDLVAVGGLRGTIAWTGLDDPDAEVTVTADVVLEG
jgi:valyl-tRNA synthetase